MGRPWQTAGLGGAWTFAISGGQLCGWNPTSVACSGQNYYGQLGNGGTTDGSSFTTVGGGLPGATAKVVAGDQFACALYPTGQLWCWGDDLAGELGTGTNAMISTMAVRATATADWADVAAGDVHTCGVKTDGTLWCWGHGDYGQLGIGTLPPSSPTPIQVGTDTDWKSVVGVHHSTCALKQDGTRWCFGAAYSGQYGDGKAWVDDFVLISPPGS
jgi:alpha-tubulin suppressor-like RCC1 family protein